MGLLDTSIVFVSGLKMRSSENAPKNNTKMAYVSSYLKDTYLIFKAY
jgi:hypothetical protein